MTSSYICWTDLEYSDSDATKGKILEVGVVVTNNSKECEEKESFSFVFHRDESFLEAMSEWHKQTYKNNGLWNECISSKLVEDDANDGLVDNLDVYKKGELLIGGTGMKVDVEYLNRYLPDFYKLFSGTIDTEELKEKHGSLPAHIEEELGSKTHRAVEDARRSAAIYRYYKSIGA